MKDEILRILTMVNEGKISQEKAAELIDALYQREEKTNSDYDSRILKVKVLSHEGDNVNVNFPVKAAKAILKATGKFPIPMENQTANIDMNALIEALDASVIGKIVDVKSADGDIVEVTIE
ncbi:MAG: hypothetical protein N2486_00230 [Caloramator sp.]|nr:hypothetical protein [Caloramator sp.]